MILLGGTILLTIVLNRAFCGWICPLGTLQMLFHKAARFVKIKKIQVPRKFDRVLSSLKYVILVVVLYATWQAGDLVYDAYDPWAAYAHLAAGLTEVYDNFLVGFIFLLVALVGSIWIPNNFCRYFCPMGAFLSILAKFSPTRLHRRESCISCKMCNRKCPAQIELCQGPQVRSTQCLSCGDCLVGCPGENCLEYRVAGKFRLNWIVYGVLAILLFFAPVLIAKQVNAWKTGAIAERLVDSAGVKNPYNITGSMTVATIAEEFEIPPAAFQERFQLPDDFDPQQSLKDLMASTGIRPRDVRDFVAEYLQQQNPGLTFDTSPEDDH